jgi:hypothetical protein
VRHIYAYRITYLLAALIVGAAVLFAWLRSREFVVVPEDKSGAPTTARQLDLALEQVGEIRPALGPRD